MSWQLGKDGKTLVWVGSGPVPMLSGSEQRAQRSQLQQGGSAKAPPPGALIQAGKVKSPYNIPKQANAGNVNYGDNRYIQKHGAAPTGAAQANPNDPNSAWTGNAGMIQKNATILQAPGGRIVLNPDGFSFFVADHAEQAAGGGGGGGGGGGSPPPPLALPPVPKPQQIPFPRQAGASSLGAPNQTWDWLLEMLAAPGLLSPQMNQLGTYLAQNSTANNQGYSPVISDPNFGGLFGTPTSPSPATQMQMPSFIGNAVGNTPWQGSQLGLPAGPTPSGSLNLGSLLQRQTNAPNSWLSGLGSLGGGGLAGGSSRK